MKSEYRILSLGAGVQSTTLALKIADGVLPMVDASIFADTQEEPGAVYDHLTWLIGRTKHAFPTLIRTVGKLGDHLMVGRNSRGGRFASVPFFTKSPGDKREGKIRRQCTKEYKTEVIEKCIRREILMLKPRQHIPKSVTIIQIIGLSFDEPGRVLRTRTRFEAGNPRFRAEFPLFDGGITRQDCMDWLAKVVPHEVPRSACVFCPYHDNREWARIKLEDPAGWARAVEVDKSLRIAGNVVNRNMDRAMFVHRQCVPLDQADLTVPDRPKREAHPDLFRTMAHECSGMCGL